MIVKYVRRTIQLMAQLDRSAFAACMMWSDSHAH